MAAFPNNTDLCPPTSYDPLALFLTLASTYLPLCTCMYPQVAVQFGHQVSFEGEVTKEKLTEQLVGTSWRKEEAEELFSLLQSKHSGGKGRCLAASSPLDSPPSPSFVGSLLCLTKSLRLRLCLTVGSRAPTHHFCSVLFRGFVLLSAPPTPGLRRESLLKFNPTELRLTFDEMDHTKDGNLDISELENGLRPLGLEKSELKMLFQSIDTSGDGTIRLLDWVFPHIAALHQVFFCASFGPCSVAVPLVSSLAPSQAIYSRPCLGPDGYQESEDAGGYSRASLTCAYAGACFLSPMHSKDEFIHFQMNYWLYRQRAKKATQAMKYVRAAECWEVRGGSTERRGEEREIGE